MIKKQLSLARQLITEQWQATLGNKLNNQIKEQIEEISREHFFDQDSYNQNPQIIRASKKIFSYMPLKERAVFILKKSRQFSNREIGSLLGVSRSTVDRIYKSAA